MEHVITAGRFVVGLLAIGTSVVLGAYLFGRRDRVAVRPLLGVAVVLSIGALSHVLITGPAPTDDALALIGWQPADGWWVIQGATVTIVASGIWTLFAFEYTGRSETSVRGLLASVALLVAGAVLLTVRAASAGSSRAVVDGLAVLLLLTALSTVVGVCLLLWTSCRQNAFPVVEPLLLAGGIVALLPGIFLAQLSGFTWLYPATIAVASGSFLAAVGGYPTFDTLPAARVAGRDRVVDELSTGVLVVDRHGRIQDCNARAESLFGVRAETVTGVPLADLLGIDVADDLAAAEEPLEFAIDRGIVLELTGSPITGHGDRSFGTLLLCDDVTQRRIREERLSILRQFVVDVVGERMDEIAASAAVARHDEAAGLVNSAERDDDLAERARQDDDSRDSAVQDDLAGRAEDIWTTTTALTTLVSRARDVERAVATSDDRDRHLVGETDLRDRIRAVVASVTEGTDQSPAVELPDAPFRTAVPLPLFETMLRTLLAEARRHARDPITITGTMASEPTIRIRCDRPANGKFDDASGADRPFPVTRLAVDQAGGTVRVEDLADGQSCLTIELPPPGADSDRLVASPRTRDARVHGDGQPGSAGPSSVDPKPADATEEDGR